MDRPTKVMMAELVGTTVLMLGGPGSAVLAGDRIGTLGVALAFGLSLLVMAYVIGPISGCHINPAVSVALWISRKIDRRHMTFAILGQLLGAVVGGFIIWVIAHGHKGFDATNKFAQNGWGHWSPGQYNLGATMVVEIVFTAVLVIVVLATTDHRFAVGMYGMAVGFTLTVIHLVTIPVDNTSVNPARSIGAALFAGRAAIRQLPVFIVFPLIGAVLGVVVWLAVDDSRLEDTMLANRATVATRDAMTKVVDTAVDAID